MKAMHLDPHRLRKLLAGQLERESCRALSEHLLDPCQECEELLAGGDRVGPLDVAADLALARAAPGLPGNDLEFARIRRAVEARPRASRPWRLAGVAAAAVLVAAGGLAWLQLRSRPRSDWEGVKGLAEPAPVRLRFAVVRPGAPGQAPVVEKGQPGSVVARGASLLFQFDLAQPADVALVRLGPDGQGELVYHQRHEKPGTVDVSLGGRPAAYPLAELSGVQRFVLVAGPEPMSSQQALEAARTLQAGAAVGRGKPAALSSDLLEVKVE